MSNELRFVVLAYGGFTITILFPSSLRDHLITKIKSYNTDRQELDGYLVILDEMVDVDLSKPKEFLQKMEIYEMLS